MLNRQAYSVYKIVFGLVGVCLSDFFVSQFNVARRGHRYKLYLPPCRSNVRFNCLNYRTIRTWNSLPADVDFTSKQFQKFTESHAINTVLQSFIHMNFNSHNIVSGQSGPFVLINVFTIQYWPIQYNVISFCFAVLLLQKLET